MKKAEFDILLYMNEHESADFTEAARILYRPEEEVAEIYRKLSDEGYLRADGLTRKREDMPAAKIMALSILCVCRTSSSKWGNFDREADKSATRKRNRRNRYSCGTYEGAI